MRPSRTVSTRSTGVAAVPLFHPCTPRRLGSCRTSWGWPQGSSRPTPSALTRLPGTPISLAPLGTLAWRPSPPRSTLPLAASFRCPRPRALLPPPTTRPLPRRRPRRALSRPLPSRPPCPSLRRSPRRSPLLRSRLLCPWTGGGFRARVGVGARPPSPFRSACRRRCRRGRRRRRLPPLLDQRLLPRPLPHPGAGGAAADVVVAVAIR